MPQGRGFDSLKCFSVFLSISAADRRILLPELSDEDSEDSDSLSLGPAGSSHRSTPHNHGDGAVAADDHDLDDVRARRKKECHDPLLV